MNNLNQFQPVTADVVDVSALHEAQGSQAHNVWQGVGHFLKRFVSFTPAEPQSVRLESMSEHFNNAQKRNVHQFAGGVDVYFQQYPTPQAVVVEA